MVINAIAAEIWTSVWGRVDSAFQITHKCFFFMASQLESCWQEVLRNVVPKLLARASPTEYVPKSAGMLLRYSQYNMPSEIKAFIKMTFGQMIL